MESEREFIDIKNLKDNEKFFFQAIRIISRWAHASDEYVLENLPLHLFDEYGKEETINFLREEAKSNECRQKEFSQILLKQIEVNNRI